jgi:hypothetical protein
VCPPRAGSSQAGRLGCRSDRIGKIATTCLALLAILALTGCTRGAYAPAVPLAEDMDPEWREFAYQVDAACATNFNAGQAELATLEGRDDLSDPEWEAAYRSIQAAHQQRTYDDIAALGPPPAKPRLFARWLANVGRRAELMRRIARAWRSGNRRLVAANALRIDAAKIEADWLALHFGLRICPSNGPMQNRDPSLSYLEELNGVCQNRLYRDDTLRSDDRFTPTAVLRNSLGETVGMAAVAPPLEQFPLRRKILRIKRSLDRFHVAAIRRAARGPGPQAWTDVKEIVAPRITRSRQRLARLGLKQCAWPHSWR